MARCMASLPCSVTKNSCYSDKGRPFRKLYCCSFWNKKGFARNQAVPGESLKKPRAKSGAPVAHSEASRSGEFIVNIHFRSRRVANFNSNCHVEFRAGTLLLAMFLGQRTSTIRKLAPRKSDLISQSNFRSSSHRLRNLMFRVGRIWVCPTEVTLCFRHFTFSAKVLSIASDAGAFKGVSATS